MASAEQPPAIQAAAYWLATLLTGGVATAIGVLAVAGIAYAMFDGQLPVKRAIRTLLGGFTFFGAAAIAGSLLNMTSRRADAPPDATPALAPPVSVENGGSAVVPLPADPYAGASAPNR